MSIEIRENKGRLYRYVKTKRNGECVSTYAGPVTREEAAAERALRLEEEAARRRAGIILAELDATLGRVRSHAETVDHMYQSAMTAAGYHRNRDTWRKGRFMDVDAEALAILTEPGRFEAIISLAKLGDHEAAGMLRAIFELDDRPEFLDTFVDLLGGDVAAKVERSLLAIYAGEDLAMVEAARTRFRQFRATILEAGDSAIERLMADRVALTWLAVHVLEVKSYEAAAAIRPADAASAALLDQLQRRAAVAGRQLDSAVKTLALTRRLAIPVAREESARLRIARTA